MLKKPKKRNHGDSESSDNDEGGDDNEGGDESQKKRKAYV